MPAVARIANANRPVNRSEAEMPKVRILLAPPEMQGKFYVRDGVAKLVSYFKERYVMLPPIECWQVGEAAAEEMFDLTNNPSRQEERLQRYGNGKSLSVGDMVLVDDVYFVCGPVSWLTL